MIRINQVKLPIEAGENELIAAAAKVLRCPARKLKSVEVARRAVDSRKKSEVHFVYHLNVTVDGDEDAILARAKEGKAEKYTPFKYEMPENKRVSKLRPVVIGFGPAGIFAAQTLAKAGLKPIVLERGDCVENRTRAVKSFWETKELDENSNVQFGEGGAGTFSDGKLTTGIKDTLCRQVFLEFARHGAPQEILYSATPHIGTDRLGGVVKSMREEIISMGGEIKFRCRLTGLIVANGFIHGIVYEDQRGKTQELEADTVILAIGHSARDTVEMLYNSGIKMIQKPFSVGTRIEHPRELIDRSQYGDFAGHPKLGAANYKLSCHPQGGRGAYTFCMCPGGTVVAASSEKGRMVVNGMSEYARDGENSNSAILVGIEPSDFGSDHPLAGIELQREIESKAFILGGGDYRAPAQLVGDFLDGEPSTKLGSVCPSCPTGVTPSDIRQCLPKKVTDTIADALIKMDKQLKGFALPDAVLTAPESRSSSPVRITRDEYYQCNIGGIFPCGEGAGYAGGIVSAGVDGIRCAHAVLADENNF